MPLSLARPNAVLGGLTQGEDTDYGLKPKRERREGKGVNKIQQQGEKQDRKDVEKIGEVIQGKDCLGFFAP